MEQQRHQTGEAVNGPYYGTFSNRNGLGHPVFLVVLLIDPTEMLQ